MAFNLSISGPESSIAIDLVVLKVLQALFHVPLRPAGAFVLKEVKVDFQVSFAWHFKHRPRFV